MSNHDDEQPGITDEELPEELQPTDDNPLAQPLTDEDEPKSAEELDMFGGKTPEQTGERDGDDEGDGDDAND